MDAVTVVDGDLSWAERPDPEPGKGELLVGVRAAGLNAEEAYKLLRGNAINVYGLDRFGITA